MDVVGTRQGMVGRPLATLDIVDEETAHAMADTFPREREEAIEPFLGAIETVRVLRDRGVKLGLITNVGAVFRRPKVVRFGLEPLFDNIVIEGEFGVGKPNPAVYRHVLDELGVEASDAWMVGDTLEWEIGIPQDLGLKRIWVDGYGTRSADGQ